MTSYDFVLQLHSLMRLALVLLSVWVFWISLRGWLGRSGPNMFNRLLVLLAMIIADLQLVAGLWLYFGLSPVVATARSDMSAAMKNPELRFFAVEHGLAMLLAVVSLHLGKIGAARAAKVGNETGSYRRLVLGFGIALALILVMSPWPFTHVVRPLWRIGSP